MYTIMLVVHLVISVVLVGLILIQRGRSSGLVEAMGGVESIFGAKTSALFVKVTVVLSVVFFLTSMSLAYLSKQRSASLLENVVSQPATAVEVQKQARDATAVSEELPSVSREEMQTQVFPEAVKPAEAPSRIDVVPPTDESPQNVGVNEEKTE